MFLVLIFRSAQVIAMTTSHRFAAGQHPFATFCDTGAATALAASLATKLHARHENPGWLLFVAKGDLAPPSTTSITWSRSSKSPKMPLKPDIVMEAGNMGLPPRGGAPDFLDELQLFDVLGIIA